MPVAVDLDLRGTERERRRAELSGWERRDDGRRDRWYRTRAGERDLADLVAVVHPDEQLARLRRQGVVQRRRFRGTSGDQDTNALRGVDGRTVGDELHVTDIDIVVVLGAVLEGHRQLRARAVRAWRE